MTLPRPFHWLDVGRIGEELAERHPSVDPTSVRFTTLRSMVEAIPGFSPDPRHPVNERILEAIQAAWLDELDDANAIDDE